MVYESCGHNIIHCTGEEPPALQHYYDSIITTTICDSDRVDSCMIRRITIYSVCRGEKLKERKVTPCITFYFYFLCYLWYGSTSSVHLKGRLCLKGPLRVSRKCQTKINNMAVVFLYVQL